MKATVIQSKETNEIIMYLINNVRVNMYDYHNLINSHKYWHNGCYNTSYTTFTKSGNYKHVAYYSI